MATHDKYHHKNKKKLRSKYSSLKQTLEPRMLFDASIASAPTDPAILNDLSATSTTISDASTTAATSNTDSSVSTASSDSTLDQTAEPISPAMATETPTTSDINKAGVVTGEPTNSDTLEGQTTINLQEFTAFQAPAPKELIFIDSRIKDPMALLEDVSANAEIYYIDSRYDGIAQMDNIIKSADGPIAAIHLISHGGNANIEVGSTLLNSESLHDQYANTLASWNAQLTKDADVLIYGCDIAQDVLGKQFVNELSSIIGRDIAASADTTGAEIYGGDWVLEYQTGLIAHGPTSVFSPGALASFGSVLAKPVVDLNGPALFTVTEGFSVNNYSGGTGWTSDWLEFDASWSRAFTPSGSTNSDNSPISGNIVIPAFATGGTVSGLGTGQELAFLGHTAQSGDYIERSFNLKAYTTATLSFSYRTAGLTSNDAIEIDISNNAGANFITLGTLAKII